MTSPSHGGPETRAEQKAVAGPPGDPARGLNFRRLLVGDRMPALRQRCAGNPAFAFQTMAGRYLLFGFFLSAQAEEARRDLAAVAARADLFDDEHCSFVGVSIDADDLGLLKDRIPGTRFAWDFDLSMSKACGAAPLEASRDEPLQVSPRWVLVGPSLHVVGVFQMGETPVEVVLERIEGLPPPERYGGMVRPPPVLVLPEVFDASLCRRLLDDYQAHGGEESGVDRNNTPTLDARFKRRRDHTIVDAGLLEETNWSIGRRVVREIERVWFVKLSRIERHIVACYSAGEGGHFSPHTDNGPGISAHRRFAVSINLNDGFSGGEVYFPEYGAGGYKVPAGWALVFPCGVLHGVRHVTTGERFCFLPFLFDEAGEAIRQAEWRKAGLLP